MNKKNFWHNNLLRAVLWGSIMLFSIIWLVLNFSQIKIENNLTALLQGQSNVPPQIERQLASQLNRSIMWLVGADTLYDATQTAKKLEYALLNLPQLEAIEAHQPKHQSDWQEYIFLHRSQLLTPALQQQLEQPESYFQYILSQIYSPMSGISAKELQNDPLLLMRNKALHNKQSILQWQDGWLYAKSEGKYYVLVRAMLKEEYDNLEQKSGVVLALQQIQQQLKQQYPQIEIDSRSSIYFSDYAKKSVEKDIKMIGIGSIIGILLLMLLTFRSLVPLVLLLCSLATGILWGFFAIWAIFGEIHLLTIALSTSLIGVSADYSLHFLTERYFNQNNEKVDRTLSRLRPTLLFAFITTAMAYAILGFAPLSILKQMAVYAVFGLAGALFTIFILYPALTQKNQKRTFIHWAKIESYVRFWQSGQKLPWLIGTVAMGCFISLIHLNVSDDVRLLQAQPTHLQKIEQKFDRILQQNSQLLYFIVQSNDENDLLVRLEALSSHLSKTEKIQTIISVSDYLPSLGTQKNNHQLVQNALQRLTPHFAQMGVSANSYPYSPITLNVFLKYPVSHNLRPFFFQDAENYYTLIPLTKSDDKAALEIANQLEGVSYHNTTQDWSTLFEQSRNHILFILLGSFIVAGAILSYQFGLRIALTMLSVIGVSMLVALSSLVLTGQYFNLFSALALILILGMGLDYGIFLLKSQKFISTSFIAVILSALTTQLSFGLLMLSSTTALVSFATVLCVGISFAFLLSPLVLRAKR
ncbi:Predicted exporter [Pasteurella multocida]|nr:Predicted exporter [Pasteurella multocida]